MTKIVGLCVVALWIVASVILIILAPWALSDKNKFFAGFVNQEFLTFMGVVVTISLASAQNLFVEIKRMEGKVKK
jgi:NADH:ubiquinone oxidoreductase subunit 3 (subunit A)